MGKGSGSGCGALLHHRPQVSPIVSTKASKQPMHFVATQPKGLINVGNTCYANAALQCLLSTALTPALLDPKAVDTFRRYSSNPTLLALPDKSIESMQSQDSDGSRTTDTPSRKETRRQRRDYRKLQHSSRWLTRELTNMTKEYTSTTPAGMTSQPWWLIASSTPCCVVMNPANITRHPDKLSNCLRPYQQEDAHEFLRALLSTLTMNGHNTQLSSLFDGLLESAVTCMCCGHSSLTRDRYMDLSLDISHDCTSTIMDALEEFTKTEVLDGDNQVYCTTCKDKQQATKGLRLATAPSILVCHLKRFAFDKYGNLSRINKNVEFPQELLIGDCMSKVNKSTPPPYDLVGVLVHEGLSCDAGHYLAYVKAGSDWYRANDSVVQKVELDLVLKQQAYVLLYEVAGMRHETVVCNNKETKMEHNMPREQQLDAKDPILMSSPAIPTRESTVTSTLMSFFCGASELNDNVIREFCLRGNVSAGQCASDSISVTTETSGSTVSDTSRVQKLHRKSNSSSNIQAFETQVQRTYRASTLSPSRRVHSNRTRSLSNSDPGVRYLSGAEYGPNIISKRNTNDQFKGFPLPPRPSGHHPRHSSGVFLAPDPQWPIKRCSEQ